MDIFSLYQKFIACNQNISTDTRTQSPGAMYIAWKGAEHDGNDFVKEAFKKGAKYAVVDHPRAVINTNCILVDNGMKALARLAHYHRRQFKVPVLAIGGSNGKTTTKQLTSAILGTQKNVVASIGSFNNHTGVPKTLLRITKDTDIVVLEFGANHADEIKKLCEIAEPSHGIITNIGRDHIGLFGSQSAIIEANVELYDYLRETGGEVLVNKHNMTLMKYSQGIERLCYGEGLENEFGIVSKKTSPYVSLMWKQEEIKTNITGEYNSENINAAIAVGVHFGITDQHIISAISNYRPSHNRSELLETDSNNIVIKDFYNANLTSMKFALENLSRIKENNPQKTTVAIMGDMLELGEYSQGEHQAAIDYARDLGIDRIIIVGPEFTKTDHNDCDSYQDVEEAIFALQKSPLQNSIVLLKASNGTNFQKLFNKVQW